jgi:hypothetical protein
MVGISVTLLNTLNLKRSQRHLGLIQIYFLPLKTCQNHQVEDPARIGVRGQCQGDEALKAICQLGLQFTKKWMAASRYDLGLEAILMQSELLFSLVVVVLANLNYVPLVMMELSSDG